MKIFHVKRNDRCDYDNYSDFVCIAVDENAAKRTHPRPSDKLLCDDDGRFYELLWNGKKEFQDYVWPANANDVTVTCIGTANEEAEAGVICASFHAG